MKALVIGGTGFIGRRLVDQLLRENIDVTIASSGNSGNPFGDAVDFIVFNRFDRLSIEEKLYSPPFYDTVYDMLGFRLKDIRDMVEIFNKRTSRYVFVSSAAVYSGKTGILREEDFDPMNTDLSGNSEDRNYDEGKRRCESYLFQKASFPVVVARFPNVLGHDDSTSRFQNHMSMIVQGEKFLVPERDGRRNYAWVEDAGRFLSWLGINEKTGIYNGASKEAFKLEEIIERMASGINKKVVIERTGDLSSNSRYFSPFEYILSTEKAEREGFAFTPSGKWIGQEASLWEKTGGTSPNSRDYAKDLF